jgi:hypothetical protein
MLIKAIVKVLVFNIPFILVSAYMFYSGYTAADHETTGDGYNLKWFFYLMGTGFLVFPLGIGFAMLIGMMIKKKRMDELIAEGKQGTAVVLQLADTGTKINGNPRVTLVLEIHIPNYQPYKAQKTVTIPIVFLSQVQTGSTINVLADPDQPNEEKRIALLLK